MKYNDAVNNTANMACLRLYEVPANKTGLNERLCKLIGPTGWSEKF